MTNVTPAVRSSSPTVWHARRMLVYLDHVPQAVLALPLGLAVATVFWESALYLFRAHYNVPLIPPEPAAFWPSQSNWPPRLTRGWAWRLAS